MDFIYQIFDAIKAIIAQFQEMIGKARGIGDGKGLDFFNF